MNAKFGSLIRSFSQVPKVLQLLSEFGNASVGRVADMVGVNSHFQQVISCDVSNCNYLAVRIEQTSKLGENTCINIDFFLSGSSIGERLRCTMGVERKSVP